MFAISSRADHELRTGLGARQQRPRRGRLPLQRPVWVPQNAHAAVSRLPRRQHLSAWPRLRSFAAAYVVRLPAT